MGELQIEPTALREIVRFGRPVTGRELRDAVETSIVNARTDAGHDDIRSLGPEFYESGTDEPHHVIGQTSPFLSESLLVVPDVDDPDLDVDRAYTEATVIRHDAHNQTVMFPMDFGPEDEQRAVTVLAKNLQKTLQQNHAATVGLDRDPVARRSPESRGAELPGNRDRAGERPERPGPRRPGPRGNLGRG